MTTLVTDRAVVGKRAELRERFDELYRDLNPAAAAEARLAKLQKIQGKGQ